MKQSLALAAAFIVLVGCGNSSQGYKPVEPKPVAKATVAAGEEASLFPLTEGNVWRYDSEIRQLTSAGAVPQKYEVSIEVKKVADIAGGKRATVELSKGEVLQDRQIWRVDKTGMFQEQAGVERVIKSTPPVPSALFPIEVGKVTQWSGMAPTLKGPIAAKADLVNRGPEEVDTIVGTLSAYRVETKQTYKNEKGDLVVTDATSWWAPKIGLVKHRQEVKIGTTIVQSQLLVLKQYTVK